MHTLTRFWPEDIKIQQRYPEIFSYILPRPFFFATTKPWPTTRRGEKSIAWDGSLSVCFLPSLQVMWILKVRVAKTIDQFQGPNVLRNPVFCHFRHFPIFRFHESDLEARQSPATEFSGPWGLAGTKIHTLTTFWPEDIKIQRRDLEKSSKNLPRPYFFQTTKPSPICRRAYVR